MKNKLGSKRKHTEPVSLSMLPARVPTKGWYHLLQKLTGRRLNPGLQMFGQAISGNVDMDGNGYAGLCQSTDEDPCVPLWVTGFRCAHS